MQRIIKSHDKSKVIQEPIIFSWVACYRLNDSVHKIKLDNARTYRRIRETKMRMLSSERLSDDPQTLNILEQSLIMGEEILVDTIKIVDTWKKRLSHDMKELPCPN